MLLALTMPRMGDQMHAGVLSRLYLAEGALVAPGAKMIDVRVDLGAVADQDCPPAFSFRMVAREKGWVRKLSVGAGDVRQVGDVLALISTTPDESADGPPARAMRTTNASILTTPSWLAPDQGG